MKHKKTWFDFIIDCTQSAPKAARFLIVGTTVGVTTFYAVVWVMSPFIGVAAPRGLVTMLVLFSLLFGVATGVAVAVEVTKYVNRRNQKRGVDEPNKLG